MALSLGPRDRITTLPKVNRRALRKYGEFWRALQVVGDAVYDAQQLAAKARDEQGKAKNKAGKGVSAKAGHTATAAMGRVSGEEMASSAKKANRSLEVITTAAKKWEAELISREWRK
ncbi:hypothetical protein [Pseudonocardia sp. HH130630-07]|uniref:hypothetical protein n=1 Tax=Pseudonocardia sp. HH130630-07 TaxID=1690815 RepID=UPI00081522AD|nr:hypothetical protein [Pseudonocardia sp. HH130630-07]ANY05560.1 hypothetical protein AFB00_03725 [Pseudonocardia sp. HH130630-07]